MSSVPTDLRYAKYHEWIRPSVDGVSTVGITDYAQNSLGDITYVQLPKVGATFAAGAVFGVVESVKAASDLYAPLAFTVLEVNALLDKTPETVNQAPYGEGCMLKVKPAAAGEQAGLLDAAAYRAAIG